MAIPILGRLSWYDYKRLFLATAILILECTLRFVAWIVPVSVLDFLRYRVFRYAGIVADGRVACPLISPSVSRLGLSPVSFRDFMMRRLRRSGILCMTPTRRRN